MRETRRSWPAVGLYGNHLFVVISILPLLLGMVITESYDGYSPWLIATYQKTRLARYKYDKHLGEHRC